MRFTRPSVGHAAVRSADRPSVCEARLKISATGLRGKLAGAGADFVCQSTSPRRFTGTAKVILEVFEAMAPEPSTSHVMGWGNRPALLMVDVCTACWLLSVLGAIFID